MAGTETLAPANNREAVAYLEAQFEKGEKANLPKNVGAVAACWDDFPDTETYENIVLGVN